MPKRTEESIRSNIEEWLDTDERLLEFTVGDREGIMAETIVALTSSGIRLGSVTGGKTIPLSAIRYVKWSGLGARLNIGTASPSKRLVYSINGKEWRGRAAKLAQAWADLEQS